MDKKLPMTGKSSDRSVKVVIEGIDDIFASSLDAESIIGKYEKFAEHVILSCAMPEIPRYTLEDKSLEGSPIPQAYELLDNLLVRYRRMTAWMRQNGIDPESVAGKGGDNKPSKN